MKNALWLVGIILMAACSEPAKQTQSQIKVLPGQKHNRLAIVSSSPDPNIGPGKLLVLDLKEGKVTESSTRIGNDPLLKRYLQTSEMLLVDRSHNTILVFDPQTLALKRELRPLPNISYTNFTDLLEMPQGELIAVSYETAWLYRLRVKDGSQVPDGAIGLHRYADADNIPEAHKILKVGDKLFMTLQRLNRNNAFEPTDYSSVLEIDWRKNAVIAEHRLVEPDGNASCKNPTTTPRELPDGTILLGCSGSYNDANSGGVVGVINPMGGMETYRGVKWRQEELLGKPTELINFGANHVFTIAINNVKRSTSVVSLEGADAQVLAAAPYTEGYRSLLYDDERNLLWMGKATKTGGEVVAIDPSTKNILRRLDTEYEPVQLEWLD